MLKNLCPGCSRHCYLDEAQCERGMEYARTGTLPPRRPHLEGNHDGRHSEQKQKYLAMTASERILWNLGQLGGAAQEHPEMLSCLREEERADLLLLLERLRHSLRRRENT